MTDKIHPYVNGYLLLVAQEEITGNIYVFSDCPLGMNSNGEHFCGLCDIGTYGPTCLVHSFII